MREVMTGSCRKVDNDFDVVATMLHRFRPALDRHPPRNQARKPLLLRPRENVGRHLIMPTIRVDRAEYGLVVEDHSSIVQPDIELAVRGRGDARKTDDSARSGAGEDVADQTWR